MRLHRFLSLTGVTLLLLGGSVAFNSCKGRHKAGEPFTFDPLVLLQSLQPVLEPVHAALPVRQEALASEDLSTRRQDRYRTQVRYFLPEGRTLVLEMDFAISPTLITLDYTVTPEQDTDDPPACYGLAFRPRGLKGIRYEKRAGAPEPYTSGAPATKSILLDLWEGTMRIAGDAFLTQDPAFPDEVFILGGIRQEGAPPTPPYRGRLRFTME